MGIPFSGSETVQLTIDQGLPFSGSETIQSKIKTSMARSLPLENLLPQNVGSIINYLQ